VPFVDLLAAVVRRTRAGRSPFAADKQHLHHRLLEIGHSHLRAVLITYFWSALIAFGAIGIGMVDGKTPIVAATVGLVVLGLVLLGLPRLRRRRGGAVPAGDGGSGSDTGGVADDPEDRPVVL
jgi:UDP-GlcNAc:undecaprenyl-phosphate GlcNAc-1-phosphate transferase